MTVERRDWIAALALAAALSHPARAADLAADLAGRSLTCGSEQALYLTEDLANVMILTSAAGDFAVDERSARLTPKSRSADQISFATEGADGRRVYRLERSAPLGRGRRKVVLFVGDDPTGDDCFVERSRAAFVTARFNAIRESLCGNDPLKSCVGALGRTCGRDPTPACVMKLRPTLNAINRRASSR